MAYEAVALSPPPSPVLKTAGIYGYQTGARALPHVITIER